MEGPYAFPESVIDIEPQTGLVLGSPTDGTLLGMDQYGITEPLTITDNEDLFVVATITNLIAFSKGIKQNKTKYR